MKNPSRLVQVKLKSFNFYLQFEFRDGNSSFHILFIKVLNDNLYSRIL